MNPEPGDKSIQVTRNDVTRALQAVGVSPGDTVLFHIALSSMGSVVGGADTVIDGFLDAVGPTGTVAVPTLCRYEPEEQPLAFERWDPKTTPAYIGRVPETFRCRPQAIRSNHATHSVAAIGARAVELTANHGASGARPSPWGDAAFAKASPWERLREWNAAYGFVGVTFRVCTMVHYVESRLVERALERAAPDRRTALADELKGWMKEGIWPAISSEGREGIEQILAKEGIVRYGTLGSATLRCARARPMVERWLAIVESEPDRWLSEEFVRWRDRGTVGL
ncbi:MAG: AAC(3) family N-acetyltransferase [Kiritimatiellae bacterium]|nr:AAC(3) family N-acetyltransferase [Kiritimatiellia bacterium]